MTIYVRYDNEKQISYYQFNFQRCFFVLRMLIHPETIKLIEFMLSKYLFEYFTVINSLMLK